MKKLSYDKIFICSLNKKYLAVFTGKEVKNQNFVTANSVVYHLENFSVYNSYIN